MKTSSLNRFTLSIMLAASASVAVPVVFAGEHGGGIRPCRPPKCGKVVEAPKPAKESNVVAQEAQTGHAPASGQTSGNANPAGGQQGQGFMMCNGGPCFQPN